MISLEHYVSFLILGMTITYTPGPMTVFLMNNGVDHGYRKTLPAMFGASTSNVISIFIFAFGFSTLLKQHAEYLALIRYIGALYMLYLAYKKFTATKVNVITKEKSLASAYSMYLSGLITGLTNPKAILLFAIIFPQFIINSSQVGLNCAILGISYIFLQFTSGSLYCYFGAKIGNSLTNPKIQRRINLIGGVVFVAIAIWFLTISV